MAVKKKSNGRVRKKFGWAGCKETSPIVRKSFAGDPCAAGFAGSNEVSTERGQRRTQQNDEYMSNLKERQAQRAPCGKTREVHRGPHKRPKAMPMKEFQAKMIKKEDFGC